MKNKILASTLALSLLCTINPSMAHAVAPDLKIENLGPNSPEISISSAGFVYGKDNHLYSVSLASGAGGVVNIIDMETGQNVFNANLPNSPENDVRSWTVTDLGNGQALLTVSAGFGRYYIVDVNTKTVNQIPYHNISSAGTPWAADNNPRCQCNHRS